MILMPWHQLSWDRIQAARREARLPHALLVTGARGVGKKHFAHALAASLLCEQRAPGDLACGGCRGCRLFQAASHPDYTLVSPEEPGRPIRIDSIRELTARSALTAQAGGFKVVVIEPAQAMNIASSAICSGVN